MYLPLMTIDPLKPQDMDSLLSILPLPMTPEILSKSYELGIDVLEYQGLVTGLSYQDILKITSPLGLNLITNAVYNSFRNSFFKSERIETLTGKILVNDVYDFGQEKENISVYQGVASIDLLSGAFLDSRGSLVKRIVLQGERANNIIHGQGKYILEYDSDGIPLTFISKPSKYLDGNFIDFFAKVEPTDRRIVMRYDITREPQKTGIYPRGFALHHSFTDSFEGLFYLVAPLAYLESSYIDPLILPYQDFKSALLAALNGHSFLDLSEILKDVENNLIMHLLPKSYSKEDTRVLTFVNPGLESIPALNLDLFPHFVEFLYEESVGDHLPSPDFSTLEILLGIPKGQFGMNFE